MNRSAFALAMLVILSLALFLLPAPAESSVDSLIYIRANGEVEGTNKIQRSGDVYTLTGDLSGSVGYESCFISVEKDNIVIDGADRTIQGTGIGVGIHLWGRINVTIKSMRIKDFGIGISFNYLQQISDEVYSSGSSGNRILDNNIKTTYWGMDIGSNDSIISGNIITTPNPKYGINFWCHNTVFSSNQFFGGGLVIKKDAGGNTFFGNTVNGNPLVYLDGASNQVIDGAGQVFLVNCRNMLVKNINPSTDLRATIELSGTTNTDITNCSGRISLKNSHSNTVSENRLTGIKSVSTAFYGPAIELSGSHNNTITGNTITDIDSFGISLSGSAHNDIHGNVVVSAGQAGIRLEGTYSVEPFNTRYNSIHENNLINCTMGISLGITKSNVIYKNNILGSKQAIYLNNAFETSILANNIANSSELGINLHVADDNIFRHNNFLNNIKQVSESHFVYGIPISYYYSKNNLWDIGGEGNYWSNYTGNDSNADGIGDTPHIVYENYTDNYPLMNPINIFTVTLNLPDWPAYLPSSTSPNQPSEPNQTPPTKELEISILSPQNETYNNTTDVLLVFTVSEQVDWMGYSLDSQTNTTTTGNTTLISLPHGSHSLMVWANTTSGIFSTSETIYFTITEALGEELFPTTFIIVASGISIAAAGVGTLFYLRKRKR